MSNRLFIADFDGTPRSGKGSITGHIEELYPDNVLRVETGVEYRRIALGLMETGVVGDHESPANLMHAVGSLALEDMCNVAYAGPDLEALYSPEVGRTATEIATFSNVRLTVKESFLNRVQQARDNPNIRAVVLDGRGLGRLVNSLEGADLGLRMFVACSPHEMKMREAKRLGIDPASQEAVDIFMALDKVRLLDRQRDVDPVRPSDDAVDYWEFEDVDPTEDDLMVEDDLVNRYEYLKAVLAELFPSVRTGFGVMSQQTGRQVYFDTTRFGYSDDPVGTMCLTAELVFLESLIENTRNEN